MARIRTIKPEFWTSPQIVECSTNARLMFVGIWNFSDDNGIHPARSKQLKMEIFPADSFTEEQISEWVQELISVGLLYEYEAQGNKWWQVTGWHNQKIDRPNPKYPIPNSTNDSRTLGEPSTSPRPRKGREGKVDPSIHPSSARAREEKPKPEKPKPGPSVETVDIFRTMPPEIWTEENELSVLRKFTQWWNKKKPAERNNLDMLAALIAARHGEPKTDPAWYAAKCLDGGIRPNWITHAQALIKKSERTVHR